MVILEHLNTIEKQNYTISMLQKQVEKLSKEKLSGSSSEKDNAKVSEDKVKRATQVEVVEMKISKPIPTNKTSQIR